MDTNTYGQSRGRGGSYSTNFQQAGRELLTPDEVRMLDNGQAILFVRGERPMLDGKFDLKKHPLTHLTEDGGAEPFDYTAVPNAAEDLSLYSGQIDDLELLSMEDFLDDDN